MITTFRHFCSSTEVLNSYSAIGSSPEPTICNLIKQAVQLSLRNESIHIPDHMHRQRVEFPFEPKHSLADMLLLSLGCTESKKGSQQLLRVRDEHLYIEQDLLELWQHEILSYANPLPFLSATWEKHTYETCETIQSSFKALAHTLDCSTLPGIHDKQFNRLVQEDCKKKGKLVDLHIHFNGSTEFAHVWLHALQNSRFVFDELLRAEGGKIGKVALFYKQLLLSPIKTYKLLLKASILREIICKLLEDYEFFLVSGKHSKSSASISHSTINYLLSSNNSSLAFYYSILHCSKKHPFKHTRLVPSSSNLQKEGAMFLYALRVIRETKNYTLSTLLHCYILLSNIYLKLLVQQRNQYGFDQFQYITLIGGREALENTDTKSRFYQFKGMYGPDIAHIEARFAPKASVEKNIKLLEKIWNGYETATGKISKKATAIFSPKNVKSCKERDFYLEYNKNNLQLSLVAHFIKEATAKNESYRHKKLRNSLYEKASAFLLAREYFYKTNINIYNALVAKDAASNELETPPEVFAPVFRFLHRYGITNTTYHAGEDFDHILSGIRAVHEAVNFLDMRSGDRIGHGTALGIEPLFTDNMPMYCSKGSWLDNLVWMTKVISEKKELANYTHLISQFFPNIQKLYREIYKKACPDLSILWSAWTLRKLDISLWNNALMPTFKHSRQELKLLQVAESEQESFNEWLCYHSRYTQNAWNEKIEIKKDTISSELIKALQDAIINEMRQKAIIIEALPTSNIRISHYNETDSHHLLRWLSQEDTRPAPQVVIGTDDPGIFSTNLRNEYSLILNLLHKKYPSSSEKPYEIIRHLIENGHSYKFSN